MIVFIYVAYISEQDQIQDFLDIEVCLRLNPRFFRPSYFGDRIQNFLLDQILKQIWDFFTRPNLFRDHWIKGLRTLKTRHRTQPEAFHLTASWWVWGQWIIFREGSLRAHGPKWTMNIHSHSDVDDVKMCVISPEVWFWIQEKGFDSFLEAVETF